MMEEATAALDKVRELSGELTEAWRLEEESEQYPTSIKDKVKSDVFRALRTQPTTHRS